MLLTSSSAEVVRCTFDESGDISVQQFCSPTFVNCTLYRTNIRLSLLIGRAVLRNTIIAYSVGRAIYCPQGEAAFLTCCDLFGNAGGDWVGCVAGQNGQNGNISADPLFCDAPAGDLRLHTGSPCSPEHAGDCGLIGAWPVGCGVTAVEAATWGAIKAGFRP